MWRDTREHVTRSSFAIPRSERAKRRRSGGVRRSHPLRDLLAAFALGDSEVVLGLEVVGVPAGGLAAVLKAGRGLGLAQQVQGPWARPRPWSRGRGRSARGRARPSRTTPRRADPPLLESAPRLTSAWTDSPGEGHQRSSPGTGAVAQQQALTTVPFRSSQAAGTARPASRPGCISRGGRRSRPAGHRRCTEAVTAPAARPVPGEPAGR